MGGNEQIPPDDINTALKHDLRLLANYINLLTENSESVEDLSPLRLDISQYLDGTRIYIQGSMWDGFANGKGDFTDGPYEIQNPEDFFKADFYNYGFNPEVGSVGMPVAATIKATMPPEGWQIPLFKLSDGYIEEVPNPIWEYHKYIAYSRPGKVHDQIELYGAPKDLEDFCLKVNFYFYFLFLSLLFFLYKFRYSFSVYLLNWLSCDLRLNLLTTFSIELYWRAGPPECGVNILVF